jgi:hypothetical protein
MKSPNDGAKNGDWSRKLRRRVSRLSFPSTGIQDGGGRGSEDGGVNEFASFVQHQKNRTTERGKKDQRRDLKWRVRTERGTMES